MSAKIKLEDALGEITSFNKALTAVANTVTDAGALSTILLLSQQMNERIAAIYDVVDTLSEVQFTAPSTTPKSLIHAIFTYRAAWNQYLAKAMVDDQTPVSYRREVSVLKDWRQPAENWPEADEALTVALEFLQMGDSAVVPAMIKAAKGFMLPEAQRQADATPDLLTLIDQAEATYATWTKMSGVGDLPVDCPEEQDFIAAERALIAFPCATLEDVREKARWILSSARCSAAAAVQATITDSAFTDFLKSLLGNGSRS